MSTTLSTTLSTTSHDEAAARFLPDSSLLIGDQRISSVPGGTMDKINPATGTLLGSFPVAGKAEVDAAVAAAKDAFPKWRATSPGERRRIMIRIAELLDENSEQFVMLHALESGAPVNPAFGATMAIDHFMYYAGWADKIGGELAPIYPSTGFDYVKHEPYGVIGALLTWNGPLMTAAMKVAPAIAAGNTVVIKPAELAPFAAIRFGELCLEAGLPPGVINVITGGPEAGDAIVRHPDVAKISFTGGIVTARHILRAAAETITPVVMELGGKSANVVFDDADIATAAAHATAFAMSAGQGCLLPTRLLVQAGVYDRVVEQVVNTVGQIRVGDPLDPGTVMGPVISEAARDRIRGVIDDARAAGTGELLTGGDSPSVKGFYVNPTVFGGVDNSSSLAQNEVFGPVLSVIPFSDEDEAIAIANDSTFGLAGYVHTRDVARAHRVADRLDAGFISVNGHNPMPASTPFGGNKQSGYGREGGRAGLEEFLHHKNVYVSLD
ncbi:aldehyde dehydrogenase family protein [Rhodococcus sp. T2V]|uniref:aldehyde dehydrogenase family protein n=1 Tax=Rhodococcus sp. T2V TaxID=3034164 RepID=UPI0023E0F788|nr:aldehyde dehydrogenase family protein [Rhodococcus sp. T2V]MDF3312131.1 aldehyde dehydrogenase family protein [Rhodococcus sp. T2V]